MAEKLLMLALSPTMEVGTISKWVKKEGDSIAGGDVLCEVETDKATMEYESMNEGTLLKIIIPEGGQARVGDAIGIVGEPGEDIASLVEEIEAAKKTAEQKPVVEEAPVESATPEAPAPAAAPQSVPAPVTAAPVSSGDGRIKASPLARKLAKENGLDLRLIQGSGPGRRIVKSDVDKALAGGIPAMASSASLPVMGDETVPVSQKRQIIAKRLAESKYTAPHYYLKVSVAMDNLIQARKELNARRKEKVSMNAFLIKFVTEALKRHPMVNATFAGDHIVKHGSVDVGLAVAQPDGLITPVVKQCNNKGIIAIDAELKVLIDKALNNKLVPEEYTGATFTISNLGSFGIEEFTAIINPPGSAILAVGEVKKTPVVMEDDSIVIKNMMKLTLSCDHRIIDGAVGAAFLKDLKDMMENPISVLF